MSAYACRIRKENLGAIRSEYPKFDLEEFETWMSEHVGYFLRDESSPLDCTYITAGDFFKMYAFDEPAGENLVFLRVRKI